MAPLRSSERPPWRGSETLPAPAPRPLRTVNHVSLCRGPGRRPFLRHQLFKGLERRGDGRGGPSVSSVRGLHGVPRIAWGHHQSAGQLKGSFPYSRGHPFCGVNVHGRGRAWGWFRSPAWGLFPRRAWGAFPRVAGFPQTCIKVHQAEALFRRCLKTFDTLEYPRTFSLNKPVRPSRVRLRVRFSPCFDRIGPVCPFRTPRGVLTHEAPRGGPNAHRRFSRALGCPKSPESRGRFPFWGLNVNGAPPRLRLARVGRLAKLAIPAAPFLRTVKRTGAPRARWVLPKLPNAALGHGSTFPGTPSGNSVV